MKTESYPLMSKMILVLITAAGAMIGLPSTLLANTLEFSCGTIEFKVDFSNSTVSDTMDGTYPVDWEYDGDWVRWNIKDTDEFYGVNIGTGALILDGVVNDAGCRMGDTSALSELPLSDGAYLRRAFIELPEAERLLIQSKLSENGYYASTIDGKWGRGTEAAIKNYIAENQEELPVISYSTSDGAAEAMKAAMSHMNIDTKCDNCEVGIAEASVPQSLVKEVLPSDISESIIKGLYSCLSLGSLSNSALESVAAARVEFKRGVLDPSSIRPVWVSGQSQSSKQLYETIRRAIIQCGGRIDTQDGEDRTVDITSYPERFTVTAYTTPEALQRMEAEKKAKYEAKKSLADYAANAEKAAEKRKLDAEIAERRAEAEAAAREKASATPEKLKAIETKCSESMTILSVCASLSEQDLTTALVGRGYDCSNEKLKNGAAFFGYKNICKKGSASVRIEQERVVFSCESFNVCSYSVREVGELFIKEGFVQEMVPNVEFINNVVVEEYCGRGSKQEKLCASNEFDIIGQPIMVISMERKVGGTVAPTFD